MLEPQVIHPTHEHDRTPRQLEDPWRTEQVHQYGGPIYGHNAASKEGEPGGRPFAKPSNSSSTLNPSLTLSESRGREPNAALERSPDTQEEGFDVRNHLKNHNSLGARSPISTHTNDDVAKKDSDATVLPTSVNGLTPIPGAALVEERNRTGEESYQRKATLVDGSTTQDRREDKVLKLSPAKIHELTTSPDSLPVRALTPEIPQPPQPSPSDLPSISYRLQGTDGPEPRNGAIESICVPSTNGSVEPRGSRTVSLQASAVLDEDVKPGASSSANVRPSLNSRAISTPTTVRRRRSPSRQDVLHSKISQSKPSRTTPAPLQLDKAVSDHPNQGNLDTLPSPMPTSIPLPPVSIPTYLQLELSSHRPSPLYIHRSVTSEFPYESSRVKIERLQNFLLLPPQLEQVLWFGALACLDSWLYCFTILPLRFLKAVGILSQSWLVNIFAEIHFILDFTLRGTPRVWQRRRTRGSSSFGGGSRPSDPITSSSQESTGAVRVLSNELKEATERLRSSSGKPESAARSVRGSARKHRRTKSVPSLLMPDNKADILKGLLIIATCTVLMYFDASRMYHWIRGQAAIKLYVIYNVLEVGDRLFSAIGQDVLECLFSRETLERKPDGRSKILRPFWLFVLALIYTVIHSTSLFYQVITLNVAVNSYSNALITLLMSNQFVEIKSTVFKKFEKENLFQLTCADVVERFQLWLMLTIIASRNIVETGGLNIGFSALTSSTSSSNFAATSNTSNPLTTAPRSASSILPSSFTIIPTLFSSMTAYAPTIGHVLGPFLVVLGSEMLVDWLKHAYISKFNNTRPAIYGRFLDVLAKDYYSNAFADQNLTKRLGLPVIPLSCLFIRASVQTYHMLLAAWVPAEPLIPSTATGLSSAHEYYASSSTFISSSPTSTATLGGFDSLLHRAMSTIPTIPTLSATTWINLTSLLIFLLIFLVLLALKLVLGMLLLAFARSRYRSMKVREEHEGPTHHVEGGRRVGGWGVVEVDEEKRRWIYDGDEAGLRGVREAEVRDRERKKDGGRSIEGVSRYEMVAKRIW